MINDLLEVSRADTGKLTVTPQQTALGPLVSDMFATFHQTAMAKGVELVADLPAELPAVYADPDRIRQVLSNLIDNGLKFTPARGTITVQARIDDHDPHCLCVAVRDTGCGIRPEETDKLFERLYQSREANDMSRHGLGLGLYICRELIGRHNGRIWVESQYGSGATFYFTLRIFSLSQVLAPILTTHNLLSVVLLTVMLQPKVERPLTAADNVALQEVQHILERCITPDRDMLLPGRTRRQQTTMFFIAACATAEGAEVLSQRITRQLAGCKALHKTGLEPTVSWTKVDVSAWEPDASFSRCRADLVDGIEAMMDVALVQEGI
jgi:Histidine kinase-, DNA gyrase B-, and HSP90-like ATPase